MRGTPGSAYPQPEPNATELPSSAPGRPLRRRTNYLEPQRLRPLRHAPNTSPGCRSCASAPSPAAPAGVREEHYSRNARSARNLGARNRDAAIVRCRCDDALGLPWCRSAHACRWYYYQLLIAVETCVVEPTENSAHVRTLLPSRRFALPL